MGHKHTDKKKKKPSDSFIQRYTGSNPSGMGFVIVKSLEQDILVRPNDFNTAMHGDTVLVKITRRRPAAAAYREKWNR